MTLLAFYFQKCGSKDPSELSPSFLQENKLYFFPGAIGLTKGEEKVLTSQPEASVADFTEHQGKR